MYNLCRVLKTSILAELTVRSGLGDSYIKGDDPCHVKILIILCHIDDEIVGSIQSSCYTCGVQHGLTLAISPVLQEEY
jgi:hypothetical protein